MDAEIICKILTAYKKIEDTVFVLISSIAIITNIKRIKALKTKYILFKNLTYYQSL